MRDLPEICWPDIATASNILSWLSNSTYATPFDFPVRGSRITLISIIFPILACAKKLNKSLSLAPKCSL